jgi:hypothetical protein
MTYSLDFRRHVLTVKAQERLSFCATSRRFKIGKIPYFYGVRTIKAQNKRNKPATKINMEALQEDIKTYPDAYQYERALCLKVSKTGIYWAIKRLGVSDKKTRIHPKTDADKHALFKERIDPYQAEGLTLV